MPDAKCQRVVSIQQRKLSMAKIVIICGKLFDGLGDTTLGPTEILLEGAIIVDVSSSVGRPDGANVIDLSDRTVSPGFIDTHVHLCVDGLNLARQTLQCSPVCTENLSSGVVVVKSAKDGV